VKIFANLPALLVVAALAGGAAVIGWKLWAPSVGATVEVTVPKLSALALTGKKAFDANCAACHGANGAGTDKGPPLVYDIYNPGHHDDGAFFRAVRNGVPQHHWRFGNMPPRPGVSDRDITAIVRYVRELQLANGIVYRQHNM